MKKIFLMLSFLGLTITGLGTASAQYTTNTYYYQRPYYGNSSYVSYGSGVGSYTIGCVTHYYNTSTGAEISTQNICTTYNQPTSYYYTTYPATTYYPTTYTYPTTQYYTYGYNNGSWYPGYSSSIFSNTYTNYSGYQNYLNCSYNMYGQYICY